MRKQSVYHVQWIDALGKIRDHSRKGNRYIAFNDCYTQHALEGGLHIWQVAQYEPDVERNKGQQRTVLLNLSKYANSTGTSGKNL